MIMHEDDRGGAQFQRPLDHFARVHGRMVHRTLLMHFVLDQNVLAVEKQNSEFFRLRA